jgi:hypothetical protein
MKQGIYSAVYANLDQVAELVGVITAVWAVVGAVIVMTAAPTVPGHEFARTPIAAPHAMVLPTA